MGTLTGNKGYTQPTPNGDNGIWGTELNSNLAILDNNLGGVASIDLSSGSVTASSAEAQNLVHYLSGALPSNVVYTLPAVGSLYVIYNGTSGAYSVTISCAGGGTTQVITQGKTMAVITDGTNAVSATNAYAATGGAGSFTTLAASGATTLSSTLAVTGAATLSSTLGVTGAVTLSSTLAVSGNVTMSGSATLGGSAVVKADSGTYAISISGNAATASSASAVTWNNVSSKPAAITSYAVNMDQNVAQASTPTFGGLTVGGVGLTVTGNTTLTGISGYYLDSAGTGAFGPGPINCAVNAGGLAMLADRYVASSDGRLKSERREITTDEAMRFLWQVPPMLYLKDGNGYQAWEAGFIAQDMVAAGLPQTLITSIDPDMPEERYGITGPVGRRYEMQMGATVAYLAAAVRHLAAEIERLKRGIT
jgi:hypothetical protein